MHMKADVARMVGKRENSYTANECAHSSGDFNNYNNNNNMVGLFLAVLGHTANY